MRTKILFIIAFLIIFLFAVEVFCAPPSAPTSVSGWVLSFPLQQGKRKITLNWSAVSGATGYKVYMSNDETSSVPPSDPAETDFSASTASTSYTVNNLDYETWYIFQVSAYNADGESDPVPAESIGFYIPKARLKWEEYTE